MIDIERIEKAYLRFSAIYNSLTFKTVQEPEPKKDDNGKSISAYKERGWEVRSGVRCLTRFPKEEDAQDLVNRLRNSVEDFLIEEYDRMMEEMKAAEKP